MELVAIIELVDNRTIVLHDVIKLKRFTDYITIETKKEYEVFKITEIRELQITEEFFYRMKEDRE